MAKDRESPPLSPERCEEMVGACAEEAAKIVSQAPEIFASIRSNFQASLRKGEALRKKNRNGARQTNGDAFLL